MFGRFMRLDPRPGPRVLHRVYATERFNRKTVTEKAGKAHVAARAAGSPPRRPRAARAGPRTARSPARIAPRHAAFASTLRYLCVVSLYLAILLVRAASRPTRDRNGFRSTGTRGRAPQKPVGTRHRRLHVFRLARRSVLHTRTRAYPRPGSVCESRDATGRAGARSANWLLGPVLLELDRLRRGASRSTGPEPRRPGWPERRRSRPVATRTGGRALRLRPRMCYDLCRARASRREKRDAVRSDP